MIRLRELRTQQCMSQRGLSRISRVPQSVISGIESGKLQHTTVTVCKKLADALGVHVDELIDNEGVHCMNKNLQGWIERIEELATVAEETEVTPD
ncbi:MAG: helix-turn-helix transcriptional regulator, partial [Acidibacillus sp.]|nr:helix-turn-helix transcriptional regulator [Acidibacillus sp.]